MRTQFLTQFLNVVLFIIIIIMIKSKSVNLDEVLVKTYQRLMRIKVIFIIKRCKIVF